MIALQVEMAGTRRSNDEYVTELKECIALRDEQLVAALNMVKEKDKVINSMKGKIEEGERQIVELIKTVEKLKTSHLKNENKTSRSAITEIPKLDRR